MQKGQKPETEARSLKNSLCFVLIVLLIFLYGWIGAPFVEKYKGLSLKHMWLSGDQIWKVQGLFLMAVVIGVLIALCSCGLRKPKRSVWKYLELAVSLLIVELPYISVGIADLLYPTEFRGGLHPIYNHLPEAVMLRIGFGDFMVSTLAAIWGGILVVNLLRKREG